MMTIHEMMASKQMTMYKLAQLSGLPKTTVLDICSGKSDLAGCTAKTVWKLSKALGCTMEDLMEEAAYDTESGRPLSTNYLEKELLFFYRHPFRRCKPHGLWRTAEKGICVGIPPGAR